jgi:hypothetical protein
LLNYNILNQGRDMHSLSKLFLYSYGVVGVNKPRSSLEVEVTPMEAVPMLDGELTDNLNTKNVKGKDADGSSFETTVRSGTTVTARWLPFSSNRKTAPDVRRGEKVAIWKFADADKYYWSELEYAAKLRKLETVIYTFSNTQNESDDANADTTYFLEISTHDKIIQLHTSTSDGEPFGYDFVLNTKTGTFQIRDTIENIIFLDSAAKRIVLKNAAESFIDLNAADLLINVVGNMTTRVGGNMTTTVGGDYALNANGSYKTTTPKADFVTPMLETSAQFKTGALATIGGSLSVGGGITTGAGGGGGGCSFGGPITVSGGATFSGAVFAPNIN